MDVPAHSFKTFLQFSWWRFFCLCIYKIMNFIAGLGLERINVLSLLEHKHAYNCLGWVVLHKKCIPLACRSWEDSTVCFLVNMTVGTNVCDVISRKINTESDLTVTAKCGCTSQFIQNIQQFSWSRFFLFLHIWNHESHYWLRAAAHKCFVAPRTSILHINVRDAYWVVLPQEVSVFLKLVDF